MLTEHYEKLTTDLEASGRHQKVSEILRDGLCLVEERDARVATKLEALRAAVLVGLEAVESGAYRDCVSFDELGAYLNATTYEAIAGTATN